MKKKIQYTTISALFAFAICATAKDLTLKTNDGILPTEFEWSDTSAWSPETTSVENANLKVEGNVTSTVNSTITGNVSVGKIDISVSNNSGTAFNINMTEADSLSFKDINISNSGYNQEVRFNFTKATISGGNINVVSDGVNRQLVKFSRSDSENKISGGINITNNRNIDTFVIEGSVRSAGPVTMKASGGAEGAVLSLNMWHMYFGGLSDGGIEAKHSISLNWGGYFSFDNKEDYSWRGDLSLTNTTSFTLIKSGAGAQKFTLTSLQNYFNLTKLNEGLLDLDLTAINTTFTNSLTMAGGSIRNVGDLKVNSLVLTNGEIVLGNDSGTIIVTENAEIGDSKISLNFKELTQSGEYTILEVGGDLINFDARNALTNFELSNLEGALAELAWNDNSLVLSYTVPEPAAVAALLGIAALGFALIRRRK